MTRTSMVLDHSSLVALRRLSKRLDVSQSEVVRRSLRLLDQREAQAPLTPAQALDELAKLPSARLGWKKLRVRIKQMRDDRHAADESGA